MTTLSQYLPMPRVRRMRTLRHTSTPHYHGCYMLNDPKELFGHVITDHPLKAWGLLLMRFPLALKYNTMSGEARVATYKKNRA